MRRPGRNRPGRGFQSRAQLSPEPLLQPHHRPRARDHGVTAAFIAKASPQPNCYVERFNGSVRDELLDGELFHTVLEAQVVIGEWIIGYNSFRPHRGLGMMTPAAFAATQ